MQKLYFIQNLPIEIEKAWEFFSSPKNLQKITPPNLSLKIKEPKDQNLIYSGQIIVYSVQPLWNISMEWVTEIVAVEKPYYFIDEQRFGPYKFWHHEHRFSSIENGTKMEDVIHYKIPFGIIGKTLNYFKIKKDIEYIFSYRNEILRNLFGSYEKNYSDGNK